MLRENTVTWKWEHSDEKFVSNKAKKANLKTGVSKKTKHDKFSEKQEFLTPWYRGEGGKNVRFSENLARFVFLKHLFRDSPFCLITDEFQTETSVLDFISKQKKRYKKGNQAKFIFLAWKQWKRFKEMITE